MGLASAAYRQFHRPSGPLGRLAGWIMAHRPSNVARSLWTVDLLQIEERDHVLEIGFGPRVDHSALMVRQAARRKMNVELRHGGLELVPQLGGAFDKIFSVNVLQFLRDRSEALAVIRAALKPGGMSATTVQPRHLGATAAW